MYFCYIDESGDCGKHDPQNVEKSGSKYFIISGIIVGANRWKVSLDNFKAFRKK